MLRSLWKCDRDIKNCREALCNKMFLFPLQVIVNKKPQEHLGVMIVESGWGSMIPCAIIAHLAKEGPAAKSGRLNVGDQILSVNGTSLVGLPLLECQNIIKVSKEVQSG